MVSTTTFPTLLGQRPDRSTGSFVAIGVGSILLIAASAKVNIPFWPVPFTLQTFTVLLVGALLGARLGGLVLVAYLAVGALGIPVFASGTAGPGYFLGPSCGYLVGFPLGAALVGSLAERGWDRHFLGAALAMALGTALILSLGVLWIAKDAGLQRAFEIGGRPFLAGGLFKVLLAACLLPWAWKHFKRVSDGEPLGG